jgi:prepilin-type N-terminal cleavage/methylation domain-containing protein
MGRRLHPPRETDAGAKNLVAQAFGGFREGSVCRTIGQGEADGGSAARYSGARRSRRMGADRSRAFTLIELLVVVAIIGMLVAILLPVIQNAREQSRRVRCTNNLKQIGTALLDFHQQRKKFPPSSRWPAGSDIERKNNPELYQTWVIAILPFLDGQEHYDQFDLTLPITDPKNKAARSRRVPSLLCPSDRYNDKPFNGSACSQTSNLGDDWARCNYAANAALGYMTDKSNPSECGLPMNAAYDREGWRDERIRGVMGANTSIGHKELDDGATQTVLVAEIRAGVTEFDCRGVWAMAGACPNSLWAHGYCGDDWGPNNNQSLWADDVLACSEIWAKLGGKEAAARLGMSCSGLDRANSQQTARSCHDGGVHVCLADGRVRWISDYIDVTVNDPNRVSVWDRLMLSADGNPISADQF